MKSIELKNIAIFILVLANLCFVFLLLQRQHQQSQTQDRATQELVSLFEGQGVSLDASLVSWDDPLRQLKLELDTSLCATMAQELLGQETTVVDDGQQLVYQAGQSHVVFTTTGTIEASGVLGDGDALEFVESFCHTYGYENIQAVISDGTGVVTATVTYRGINVIGTGIAFTLTEGVITGVSGTVLPQTHSATGDQAQVSSVTALSRFLAARRTMGAVVSSVTEVVACYSFQGSTSQTMALQPIWSITADNGTYCVEGTTGEVFVP